MDQIPGRSPLHGQGPGGGSDPGGETDDGTVTEENNGRGVEIHIGGDGKGLTGGPAWVGGESVLGRKTRV